MSASAHVRLGVNVDHIATLRRLRDTPYPDVLAGAQACIEGGADQITVHLREDRRHIVDDDVRRLREALTVDLNLEMAATDEMRQFALALRPYSICIVPEKREERTTEGGLDLTNPGRNQWIQRMADDARAQGMVVSLFIEPDPHDVALSRSLGAQAVELHTGSLCLAFQRGDEAGLAREWARFDAAVKEGLQQGLMVHAGHGIDEAIARVLATRSGILEYNIGHSIVCQSVFYGIREATRRMKCLLQGQEP